MQEENSAAQVQDALAEQAMDEMNQQEINETVDPGDKKAQNPPRKQKNRNLDMTQGTPWKQIVTFTLPLLLGNIFQQMYNTVDSIVVGRFVGSEALAAVGTSFSLMFLMISLFLGMSMGASVMISQYFGARDYENMRKTANTSLLLTLILGLFITVIGYVASPLILKWMNTPADVFDMAVQYLQIIFIGILTNLFYNILSGILRGLGDSRSPLIFLIIASVINIVLDLVFVIYFNMGVAGVAWATVIAQGVSAIFGFIRLGQVNEHLKLRWKDLRIQRDLARDVMRLGLPSALQQASISLGSILVQSLINTYGSAIMASFNVVMKVDALAIMPMFSFSMAITTYVGQNIGAGEMKRVQKGIRDTLRMSLSVSVFLSLLLLFFGKYVMMLFTDETAVLGPGSEILRTLAFFYPILGVSFLLSGVMRGAGDTVVPMVNSLVAMFLGRLPFAYLLTWLIGSYAGIYWSMPVGWVLGFTHIVWYYRRGKWKEKAITNQNKRPILLDDSL